MIEPQIPTAADIKEALDKLEGHRGSVVLIAIEQLEACNFTRTTWAWLSREERKALHRAIVGTERSANCQKLVRRGSG